MKLLLLVVSLVGMFSLVPLITWAVTGRRDRALESARGYLLILVGFFVLGAGAAALTLIPELWS
jgi:hypothetical protein